MSDDPRPDEAAPQPADDAADGRPEGPEAPEVRGARVEAPWEDDEHAPVPGFLVELDPYAGPLDLLLYLIKQEEVDIHDIPIARITDQYLKYMRMLELVDVTAAGEFLVMASMLMEIKSRMLLPREEAVDMEDIDDPRMELVRRLLEYRRFKEAARDLEERGETQARRVPVTAPAPDLPDDEEAGEDDDELEMDLSGVGVFDLLTAFEKVMRDIRLDRPTTLRRDDVPLSVLMEDLMDVMTERRSMAFADLFDDRGDKTTIIGTFLALLELIRQRRLRAEQHGTEDIRIVVREDAPAGPLEAPPPIEDPGTEQHAEESAEQDADADSEANGRSD